jgi:MoxR-like ATPase
VKVEASLADYLLELVGRTRDNTDLLVGVSPRGSLALYRAAQASALIDGRDYVLPDDIKALAVPVLAHRIVDQSTVERGDASRGESMIREILDTVPVPV